MRVHLWTADEAGSGWYRGHLPGIALTWLGHKVSIGMRVPVDEPLDAVVGCRIAMPGPAKIWQQFKDRGTRLVLDLDDDYFHLDPVNRAAYERWTDPVLRQGLINSITVADVVTVVSERLATVLRDYHPDVRVIPNGLPAQYLAAPRDYQADGRPLNVGWAGTSSTIAELPLAARALNKITEYPRLGGGVHVRLVGITPQQALATGMRGQRVGALGWVERQEHYLQAVGEFDVWCAPYRDIPFNAAKFPTKALEAGFLGIPLIASAVGAYRDAVRHGETGFLVPPGQEYLFGRYLKQLVDDPGLRQSMGLAARAHASGSILQALNQQWQAALTQSAKGAAA